MARFLKEHILMRNKLFDGMSDEFVTGAARVQNLGVACLLLPVEREIGWVVVAVAAWTVSL